MIHAVPMDEKELGYFYIPYNIVHPNVLEIAW